jgi:hypothetical protein
MPPVTVRVVARGPITSRGPEAINRQLDTFKAAIERSGASVEEAFVPVLAPGWLDHFKSVMNSGSRCVAAERRFQITGLFSSLLGTARPQQTLTLVVQAR